MKIETISINNLKPYENNAKIHTPEQIEQIKRSILEFGNNDPIAVDENNVIIEGHGRLQALQELGYKTVEIIRLTHLTADQKRAYILVHNKLTMNTGFDIDLLTEELGSIKGIDMGDFDFDMDFTIDTDMTFEDEDHEQETNKPVAERCSRGQLWQLGRHRLYCGDSTVTEDIDALTAGEYMDLCVTDPPYNVSYESKVDTSVLASTTRATSKILNDSMDDSSFFDFLQNFYTQMLRVLRPGAGFYIFHADSESLNFHAALRAAGGTVKQTLVWVKNALVPGRQDYQWKHEPCLYGWKDGASHYFINDRCQTTVFESRPDLESMTREELLHTAEFMLSELEKVNNSVIREKKPKTNDLHPTMKPVPLVARLVRNSSRRGDKVLDLFGGSGTTLMACEEACRTAYIMELDPYYCDVIISRWEEATGDKAVLLSDSNS